MNKLKWGVIPAMVVAALLLFASCSKWDDTYKEFIGNGEITYSARPDSLTAHSGLNRVQLYWLFTSDPNISKYKISWNNGRDSIVRNFNRSAGVDTIRETITNLPEGTYIFDIYTYDAKGNSSVKSEVVAKAYGSIYEGTLLPRSFRLVTRSTNDMIVTWTAPIDDILYTKVTYKDMSGKDQVILAKPDESYSLLPSFPYGGTFTYQSYFKPDSSALDTLTLASATQRFQLYNNWDQFNRIFGVGSELGVTTPNGQFRVFPASGFGFTPAIPITSLAAIRTDFSTAYNLLVTLPNTTDAKRTHVVLVNTSSGSVVDYAVIAPVSAGNYWGRQVFVNQNGVTVDTVKQWNLAFSAMGKFFSRNAITGQVKYYSTINADAANASWLFKDFTTPVVVTGVDWMKYDAIIGLSTLNYLYGRTPNGNLYRLMLNLATNTVSNETLVATGWDKYRLISSVADRILSAEGGYLWITSVNNDGTLGNTIPPTSETPVL